MDSSNVSEYPVLRRLPVIYCTEIGRIIHKFAFCEMMLRTITYNLMQVGKKIGRVAVRQPRVVDHITMIQDLEHLKSIDLKIDWKKLKEALKECESYRDRLSHGVWLDHPDSTTPVLQDFSYAYVSGPRGPRKARINPLAIAVQVKQLRNISANLDDLGNILLTIEERAAALSSP